MLSKYFRNLSPVAQYDTMSALRGPDMYMPEPAQVLKAEITGRIRAIIFDPDAFPYAGAVYNADPADEETVERVYKAAALYREVEPVGGHYRAHLVEALHVTRDHPIWGGFALALKAAL